MGTFSTNSIQVHGAPYGEASTSTTTTTKTVLKVEGNTEVKQENVQVKNQNLSVRTNFQAKTFSYSTYTDVNRWNLSWELRVRLWMSIIRKHRLSDGEWNSCHSSYDRLTLKTYTTKELFNRDRLVVIRRWYERIRRGSISDDEFKSCVTAFYRKCSVSFSDSDSKTISSIRTGATATKVSKNVDLRVRRDKSSGSTVKVKGAKKDCNCKGKKKKTTKKVVFRVYSNVDKNSLSWMDRVRVWISAVRQRKISDDEWKRYIREYRTLTSTAIDQHDTFSTDKLLLFRKWFLKVRGKDISDYEFKKCITDFYRTYSIKFTDADINNIEESRTTKTTSTTTTTEQSEIVQPVVEESEHTIETTTTTESSSSSSGGDK